ncbi:MAG: metallophosphoesterase [Patescibacteria group bacterium]
MSGLAVNTPSQTPSETSDSKQGLALAIRNGIGSLLSGRRAMLDSQTEAEPVRRNSARLDYSEVVRETEVISIPDIHGDVAALKKSLQALDLTDSNDNWIGGSKVLVLLGDYIDRGETNLEVLDYLIKIKKQAEDAGGRVDLLVGNHESMMIGAMADWSTYREVWLNSDNGGDKVFKEVRKKYNLQSEHEVWQKMKELFAPGGEYHELLNSMKLVSQVDDVLYVHGGINDVWAKIIEDEGAEGVNQRWKKAYSGLYEGDFSEFEDVTGEYGPLWIRYKTDIKDMPEKKIARIAKALKKRGVNVVVVGHDRLDFGPEMHAGFEKHGIKFIASDVGMSSVFGYGSTEGGVKIDELGNIEGKSAFGVEELHRETPPSSKAAA